MLEILHDIETLEVRAWNADDSVQGNLKPKTGQEVVIWDIGIPDSPRCSFTVDLANQQLIPDPDCIAEKLQAEADDARLKEIANMPTASLKVPILAESLKLLCKKLGFD